MATEYKKYLATEILNEERTVTYRLLSRALKVHVNDAKEMLYEFHRAENQKKSNSVHATYLVAGSRYEPESSGIVEDDKDVVMSSQPFQSSPPAPAVAIEDDTPVLSITLVREEDLEEARKSYESIVSIHIYSLGSTKAKDLQILSDANREVLEKYGGQNGPEYGTIKNKNVRKRNVGGPRLVPKDALCSPVRPKPAAQKKEDIKKEESEPKMATEIKADGTSTRVPAGKGETGSNFFGQPASSAAKQDLKTTDETPTSNTIGKSAAAPANAGLKRGNSGSIFASFAKAKPKEKSESASAVSSAAQSPAMSAVEDETMKDVSEDEEKEGVRKPKQKVRVAPNKEPVKKETATERKKREEREKKLRDMMDESDEESVKLKPALPAVATQDDDKEEEEEEGNPPEAAQPKKEKPEQKEYVEISGGRRRGKRRVMKKKTMRDEEGYLVTKEEPAWESFSEDEPVAKAKPAPLSQASQKKKPTGTKTGQGSIMSFFAKRT